MYEAVIAIEQVDVRLPRTIRAGRTRSAVGVTQH
jgi:hypothetical protein